MLMVGIDTTIRYKIKCMTWHGTPCRVVPRGPALELANALRVLAARALEEAAVLADHPLVVVALGERLAHHLVRHRAAERPAARRRCRGAGLCVWEGCNSPPASSASAVTRCLSSPVCPVQWSSLAASSPGPLLRPRSPAAVFDTVRAAIAA